MDAIIVVDMQIGLLKGEPKHDLRGVIERIKSAHYQGPRSIRRA
jgi:nicotinamidase-related amidase